jgi:hypothetical protein
MEQPIHRDPTPHTISVVGGIEVNLSPDAFHMWAEDYYRCKQDFRHRRKFSPVPFFLLCRAIELELKSRHLEQQSQKEVKRRFSHDLSKTYDALSADQRILTDEERNTLAVASGFYKDKDFEYFNPEHALQGYSPYRDILNALDAIAAKLIAAHPTAR